MLEFLGSHLVQGSLIALALALAGTAIAIGCLYRRWGRTFGAKAKDASGAAEQALLRITRMERRVDAFEPRVSALEKISEISVQKVGFLRFNPFDDTGGDQSFALALLNRNNNGVVLSGLYTRQGVRTYAKGISRGEASHPLSAEEKHVLADAMKQ